jgi:PTH2 family peptidyl-tRNA hydrolase
MPTKQVIIVRTKYPDGKGGFMKPRAGKLIAQACHASIAFITRQLQGDNTKIKLSDAAREWIESSFKKVCLQVSSEAELLEIKAKAECAGLEVHLVTDAGLTEFKGPTNTCLAIGPDNSDKIDAVTGHLKLY